MLVDTGRRKYTAPAELLRSSSIPGHDSWRISVEAGPNRPMLGQRQDTSAQVSNAARIVVSLRALRMARVARLMKLLHSPILNDLVNMVVGFVIGLPALLWVLSFMVTMLYMVGLGPPPDPAGSGAPLSHSMGIPPRTPLR